VSHEQKRDSSSPHLVTLDSYLSRHNPRHGVVGARGPVPTAATTMTNVVDIAQVDTSDSHSVHSDMQMAVSFDKDYAQLVLTAQDQDDDDDYDDESSLLTNDELLGIEFAHPASAEGSKSGNTPPFSSLANAKKHTLQTVAKSASYSMVRHSSTLVGTARNFSHRNPWGNMTVEDDNSSFRGIEEWSVAAASVLIETAFTDWGEKNDDDTVDHGGVVVWEDDSTSQRFSSYRKQTLGTHVLSVTATAKDSFGENDEDGMECGSVNSLESDCPFDERSLRGRFCGSRRVVKSTRPPTPARGPHRVGV
jgi:hypothetical protein